MTDPRTPEQLRRCEIADTSVSMLRAMDADVYSTGYTDLPLHGPVLFGAQETISPTDAHPMIESSGYGTDEYLRAIL